MSTLRECIALHEERERTRPPGAPIRLYRSATLRTEYWRQDVGFLIEQRHHAADAPLVSRVRAMAETGEHLGLDRVGHIVETVEVASGQPRRCLDCDDVHLCADRMRDCVCPACGGENIETEWAELRVAGGRT